MDKGDVLIFECKRCKRKIYGDKCDSLEEEFKSAKEPIWVHKSLFNPIGNWYCDECHNELINQIK